MPSKGSVNFGADRKVGQNDRQRQQAISASAIPRIQFSTGAARALQGFSRDLFAVSSRLEDQLDQQAEAEATVEGATDGVAGNFELRDYATIRGRAYNRSGIQTTVATMETRGIVRQAELERQYGNDPARLQRELENYHSGVSGEIDKVSPGAGAQYRRQATQRGLPAIERARDAAFKLTQDQADAALIENQAAIQAEIKAHGADLFSDNPARSQAAMQAVGVVQAQVSRVYNAVDPTTGKPLYSAKERAAAKVKFNDEVISSAALSWFDGQEDRAAAYLKFSEGKFPVNVKITGTPNKAGANISQYLLKGKNKSHVEGLNKGFRTGFASLMASAPPHIQQGLKIFSGHRSIAHQRRLWKNALRKYGSISAARKWVAPPGRSNHNHGNASDLMYNGVRLDKADPAVRKWVHQNAENHGLHFRMNHEPWHIEGIKGFQHEDTEQKVDMFQGMSEAARKRLDSEMRSRITFKNQMVDREERISEKRLAENQETAGFDLTNRLFNGGQEVDGVKVEPLDRADVVQAVRENKISAKQGEAFMKAIASPRSKVSNRSFYDEVNRRMYAGEDVTDFVIQNSDKLTASDASSFLSKNRSMNVLGDGALSKDQQFQQDRLKDSLTPDSMMAKIDPAADVRKFAALDEFRQRISEGEGARDVANDISERAERDFQTITRTKLDRLVKPRFSVDASEVGRIDIKQSKAGLIAAYKNKKISEASYKRQAKLLRDWAIAQQGIKK